jgi:carboxypeptidase C (cathepsin A)
MRKSASVALAFMISTSVAMRAFAQSGERPSAAPAVATRVSDKRLTFADLPAPRQFVTQHKTTMRGKLLTYTATAGETYITNLVGEPTASFFSFSYVKDGPPEPSRPVLFVFNGGPGAASVWLHMGVIGPKRVVLDREVNPSNTPPFGVRECPYSPLDVADLVFIDPVGTGFSHAVGNAKDSDFFGVDEDADSVARFIELWLTKNGRWNSPKFLMGESYGSVRAAVLPRALMGGVTYAGVMRGVTVDGIILLGVALNAGVRPAPNATPPAGPNPEVGLSLPSLAATAWYHNRIDRAGRTAEQIYSEAKTFGTSEYANAIAQLNAGMISSEEKARIATRLAALTGLSADIWLRGNLQIPPQAFLKQILADKGLDAGLYDSRYTMSSANSGGDPVSDDPAMGKYVPGFIAAFHEMLSRDLKVEMPIPYGSIVWEGLNFKWNYNRVGVPAGQGYAVDLATAMRRNDKLRVLVASGYFDLVTPPAAAENQIKRGHLPADRVTYRNYESGHMLYLGETAESFANDVRAFLTGSPVR